MATRTLTSIYPARPTRDGAGHLGRLSGGTDIALRTSGPARLLLLTAEPIGEPVVQHGPFVMNTRQQIERALRDWRDGTLAA